MVAAYLYHYKAIFLFKHSAMQALNLFLIGLIPVGFFVRNRDNRVYDHDES